VLWRSELLLDVDSSEGKLIIKTKLLSYLGHMSVLSIKLVRDELGALCIIGNFQFDKGRCIKHGRTERDWFEEI
jgi:hypothetical protein